MLSKDIRALSITIDYERLPNYAQQALSFGDKLAL
jgi:hypothetical protein